MWGCAGNDRYVHNPGDGLDIINDNKTGTGNVGGGGTDVIEFGCSSAEIFMFSDGATDDLYITTTTEISDGSMDEGVIIEDFFKGGDYDIEFIQLTDGVFYL